MGPGRGRDQRGGRSAGCLLRFNPYRSVVAAGADGTGSHARLKREKTLFSVCFLTRCSQHSDSRCVGFPHQQFRNTSCDSTTQSDSDTNRNRHRLPRPRGQPREAASPFPGDFDTSCRSGEPVLLAHQRLRGGPTAPSSGPIIC